MPNIICPARCPVNPPRRIFMVNSGFRHIRAPLIAVKWLQGGRFIILHTLGSAASGGSPDREKFPPSSTDARAVTARKKSPGPFEAREIRPLTKPGGDSIIVGDLRAGNQVSAPSTHTGSRYNTLCQCAARKSQRISGARSSFPSHRKPAGVFDALASRAASRPGGLLVIRQRIAMPSLSAISATYSYAAAYS
jgi:hypothetical protein